MKILSLTFLFFGLLMFAVKDGVSDTPEWKLPENSIKVPLVAQAQPYSCGAAAMLAVLLYWQVYDDYESSLYPLLKTTPENGTDPENMLKFSLDLKLTAELKMQQTLSDVEKKIDAGFTAILDFQAWPEERGTRPDTDWPSTWEDGHYAVVVGYDERNFYFMDPSVSARYAYIPKKEFVERWHDYEIRDGVRVETHQLALYIKGKTPLRDFPASLQRIE